MLQSHSRPHLAVTNDSPKVHELHGAPSLPDVNMTNTAMSQPVQNDNVKELRGVPTAPHSSVEPMEASEAIQMTPTQARLVSISQSEH